MIGMRSKTRWRGDRVRRAAQRGNFKSLRHAASALRLTAKRSIRRRKKASAPGQPPHTSRGALRKAILYDVARGRDAALIGPVYSMVGAVGAAHEFGGEYRGDDYPPRPFMGPALEEIEPRLPQFWAGSVR